MSRKRPSRHSEDQFALFLERIRDSLGDEDDAKFNEAVSNLVRQRQSHTGRNQGSRGTADPVRGGSLPERPAFGTVARAPRPAPDELPLLTTLLGRLVLSWSGNEELQVQALKLLLGTDVSSAAIVHSTLRTGTEKLALIRRLAHFKVADPETRLAFDAILDGLDAAYRARDEVSVGDRESADAHRLDRLRQAQNGLHALSEALRDVLPRLGGAIAPQGEGNPSGRQRH
ncbi:MAG: hypothetical protein JSR91_06045 [Proteobacteria bacterium]|nr:hypothetical protein [Pseudomonadota bacterium]